MFRRIASLLLAAGLCGSCSEPAIDASQSLVGASELPTADALSREKIYMTRGGGPGGGDKLTYDLQADDALIVEHSYSDHRKSGVAVQGKEAIRVSPEVARRVRHLLWRLRPARLDGQGLQKAEVRPVGCERQGPHDFGEIAIAFISEGRTTAIEDDRVGLFELPHTDSCNTPAAEEARNVVWQALGLLSQSEVTAAFERRSRER